MQTTLFRFTARLSAFAVSAGALAILLLSPNARSVDGEAVPDGQPEARLEGLMIRHDVRYALAMPREVAECDSHKERG
ncbi:MAG TPA: hypothetical protein PKE27_05045 [Povalibacter sp.]|uniref:hypothetical protein n=1 Tax=Povalibacter sp. TaxID=1962978 RepID=UPI002B83C4FE|nr:hypothetical protein [Povalibacter sp.]HMN43913.1 hypothetical protein [Povalibacter sp.]